MSIFEIVMFGTIFFDIPSHICNHHIVLIRKPFSYFIIFGDKESFVNLMTTLGIPSSIKNRSPNIVAGIVAR